MPTAQLSSSATAAYGGDLAYYFGLNGNLTGMTLSAAQLTLTNASFATGAQTIDAFSGISGDMTVVRFEVRNGTLTAVGAIDGALADSSGNVLGHISQELAPFPHAGGCRGFKGPVPPPLWMCPAM